MTPLDENTIQLFSAISEKNTLGAREAIEKGATVNARNGYGNTPLYYLMAFGTVETARLLIENGANVKDVLPEHAAYGRGGAEMTKLLLDAGADVNEETPDGYTPLLIAAGRGFTDVVKVLLEAGANVRAVGESGIRAKDLAFSRGYWETAELIAKYE